MRVHDRFEIATDGVKVRHIWHALGQFGKEPTGFSQETGVKSAIDLLVDLLAELGHLCGGRFKVIDEVFSDASIVHDQFGQIDLEANLSGVRLLSSQLQDDLMPVALR